MITRRNLMTGLLAATLLPSALRADPRPRPRPVRHASGAVPTDIEALIARANLGGSVSFAVLDAVDGTLLASRGGDEMRAPASTLKAVTALFAIDRLGAQHRFRTRVLRVGDMLILAGGGDPGLDTDQLADLAKATALAEKAAGRPAPLRFAVWGGAIPHHAEITAGQAVHLPYNPAFSGLNLNFNRVHLDWRQGHRSVEARARRNSPPAYTVAVEVADRASPLFAHSSRQNGEGWSIARRAMGPSGSRWLPVRQPELYAGDVFQTLCRAQGLVLPKPEVIASLPNGIEIAHHDSPPLTEIARQMLDYSTNLTAEIIGLAASGAGSIGASAQFMQNWLRAKGVQGTFHFRDHSGLSAQNHVSARILAEIMAGPALAAGLRGLMKPIPLRDADGKKIPSDIAIDAKTGTLNFVSNLSGYVQGPQGRVLAFAVLTGDETRRAATEGQELPEGVIGWTRRSKGLQQAIIKAWVAQYDRSAPALAVPPVTAPENAPQMVLPSQNAVTGAG